jgi:MtN3 and saliva related transmembrane protein
MEIVGWAGFALTQIFYIPQIVKILRNRDVSGLALPSWFILAVALLLYLVYSVWRHDLVFTVGNAAGMVQSFIMIALILKYRRIQAIKQNPTQ